VRTVEQGYEVVDWRGFKADRRTIAAVEWAEGKAGFQFPIAQGSYNAGGVSASAGTHDKGGVIDFRTVPLTPRKRRSMIRWLKRAGFAIWYRTPKDGMPYHAHGALRGHRNLPYSVEQQVAAFDARRNGLRSNAPDLTFRPKPRVRFSYVQDRPVAA